MGVCRRGLRRGRAAHGRARPGRVGRPPEQPRGDRPKRANAGSVASAKRRSWGGLPGHVRAVGLRQGERHFRLVCPAGPGGPGRDPRGTGGPVPPRRAGARSRSRSGRSMCMLRSCLPTALRCTGCCRRARRRDRDCRGGLAPRVTARIAPGHRRVLPPVQDWGGIQDRQLPASARPWPSTLWKPTVCAACSGWPARPRILPRLRCWNRTRRPACTRSWKRAGS